MLIWASVIFQSHFLYIKKDNIRYFKGIFDSIHDYKEIVLIIFLIQNDKSFLQEVGFSERDINRLNEEFQNILIEQHEEYLEYFENEEESIIGKILNM